MELTKTENKLDYKDFEGKLGEWGPLFKPFIEGKEMFDIMHRIKDDAFIHKEKILPFHQNTFRTFSTTRREDIKVIFYLMDPYPRFYKGGKIPQATGIAMDCSNSPDGVIQPSLENFYAAIDKELKMKVDRSPSLQYLHDQGVMMLNTDLTVKYNKTESHLGLWHPFQKYFLEEVMRGTSGIIYVLCGKHSHKMDKLIYPLANHVIKVDHPSAAQYSGGEWKSDGLFLKINKLLKDMNNYEIYWDRKEWEMYAKPPF